MFVGVLLTEPDDSIPPHQTLSSIISTKPDIPFFCMMRLFFSSNSFNMSS